MSLTIFLLIVSGISVYLFPSMIALGRNIDDKNMILIINLFLGWTIFGWAISLGMACNGKKTIYSPPTSGIDSVTKRTGKVIYGTIDRKEFIKQSSVYRDKYFSNKQSKPFTMFRDVTINEDEI